MTGKTAQPPARLAVLQEVWAGFTEASRLGLASTAAGFLAMLAVALWFFSESTLSGPWGKYLARSSLDAEGFATHRALELGATPASRPRLLVLGTSATANAIADERAMAKVLSDAMGTQWEVHLLTTPRQSVLDQMTLIETAVRFRSETDQPLVIAVGASMMRQSWTIPDLLNTENAGRLGLRSDWADDSTRALGGSPRWRFGFYPFDNYHFVAVNGCEALLRLVLRWPAPRKLDTYAPKSFRPPDQRQRPTISEKIRQGLKDSSAYDQAMAALLSRLRHLPNTKTVQIEEPLSPDFLKSMGFEGEYARVIKKFEEAGLRDAAPFLPIIRDAQVPAEAYFDDLHISGEAFQERIRLAFVKRLKPVVLERWPDE